jgi:hypothetical protein
MISSTSRMLVAITVLQGRETKSDVSDMNPGFTNLLFPLKCTHYIQLVFLSLYTQGHFSLCSWLTTFLGEGDDKMNITNAEYDSFLKAVLFWFSQTYQEWRSCFFTQ